MNNLGLKRYTVRLLPHSKLWIKEYIKSKRKILKSIRRYIIDIQHVGSTSIIGIKAKPILDIAICVKNWKSLTTIKKAMHKINYIYRGKHNSGHLFVKEIKPLIRTQHVHFVKRGDNEWNNYINFRDYLNTDKDTARKYMLLKSKLCKMYSDNRKMYTKSKDKFIKKVLRKMSAQQAGGAEK